MNTICRPLESLKLRESSGERLQGYVAKCLELGKVIGDMVELTNIQFAEIRSKFNPNVKIIPLPKPTIEQVREVDRFCRNCVAYNETCQQVIHRGGMKSVEILLKRAARKKAP